MDDSVLVRGFDRLGDLLRDWERLVERDRAFRDSICKRWAFDKLQHERMRAAGILEAVDRGDMRVIERSEHLRFTPEPRDPVAVDGERLRQDLQRDIAIELRVAGAI